MRHWKRGLVGLSVGLNIVILVGAIWLLSGQPFAMLLAHFIEPAKERRISHFETQKIFKDDIVFLGDSITEGGLWAELFPGYPVKDRGIAGDVTSGVIQRLDQILVGKPKAIFLLIGTNDLTVGASPETVASSIKEILLEIRAKSPDTRIHLQSVLPRQADFKERVETLNALLSELESDQIVWVDLYPLFFDPKDGSMNDRYSNDEVHLLGAGYQVWRDALLPYMAELG